MADDRQDRQQRLVAVDGADTSTTGTKLSYTAEGRTATVTGFSAALTGGPPTLVLEGLPAAGGTVQIGGEFSADLREGIGGLQLEPGDEIRIRCTAAAGGSTADLTLSVVEKS